MPLPANIRLIGTSHIAQESIEEIKKTLQELQPEIVALELDAQRAMALLEERKRKVSLRDILKIGWRGFIFAKIGQYVQEKLGEKVGVSPGADMKSAFLWAKKNQKNIALIDQPITITLKRFSQTLTWKEKFRFVGDLFKGLFFGKQQLRKLGLGSFNLKKVPAKDLIEKMMLQVKENYPSVYKVLVEERNRFMVRQVVKLLRENPGKKIVVVVGAGHLQGMQELLKKVEVV